MRYAVPVTGSEWCSPPGHPDLGRFGVRIAKLSAKKCNIQLEPVKSILSQLQAVPQEQIRRARSSVPTGEGERLPVNKSLLVFHYDALVHRLSSFTP